MKMGFKRQKKRNLTRNTKIENIYKLKRETNMKTKEGENITFLSFK